MKKKKIPTFKTDKEAEDFVDTADLSEYDLSGGVLTRFEMRDGVLMRYEVEKKEARVNMRLPTSLLAEVKKSAKARGIPYQRFIREALERALARGKA
jgi:predicted DNA binding CopG/RHH family protein